MSPLPSQRIVTLNDPHHGVRSGRHKWGRVLATPAPWRPAQWTPRPDARDRLCDADPMSRPLAALRVVGGPIHRR